MEAKISKMEKVSCHVFLTSINEGSIPSEQNYMAATAADEKRTSL